MARKTILQDLKTACSLEVPAKPLVMPVMDFLATSWTGTSYTDYATDSKTIAGVWSRVIDRFDIDWAGLLVDDLFEFEPLGIKVSRPPGLPSAVEDYLQATVDTCNSLRMPDPKRDGRMPVLLEAEKILRDRWADSILIGGSVAAPFTALSLMYGIEQTMLAVYDAPEVLRKSMEFAEELAVVWGTAMIESGADIIWLGDCCSSSRFIPADMYSEWSFESSKRVVSALKDAGAVLIYHAGEDSLPHLKLMAETGADALSVEGNIDLATVKDALGSKICLCGNVDSVNLLMNGTPEEIGSEVKRLVTGVASKGGCIVSAGEGLPGQTPLQNFEAFVESIRDNWTRIVVGSRCEEVSSVEHSL